MWRWWFTVLFWSGGNPSHPLFSQVPLYKSVTEMATNSCFSVSKGLASLWMLLIYPWERWKIPHGSQIYLLRAISSILKMFSLHGCSKTGFSMWGPFNPTVRLSPCFGWHSLGLGPPSTLQQWAGQEELGLSCSNPWVWKRVLSPVLLEMWTQHYESPLLENQWQI